MAGEFRKSFDEMARESELAELRKEIDNLKKNNPVSDLANSMAGVQAEISSSMEAVAPAQSAEKVAAEIVEPRSGEFEVTDSTPRPAPGA
jgi:sec-independent protein translocase protein TatB